MKRFAIGSDWKRNRFWSALVVTKYECSAQTDGNRAGLPKFTSAAKAAHFSTSLRHGWKPCPSRNFDCPGKSGFQFSPERSEQKRFVFLPFSVHSLAFRIDFPSAPSLIG